MRESASDEDILRRRWLRSTNRTNVNPADVTRVSPIPHASASRFHVPAMVLVIGSILGFELGSVISKPAIEAMGTVHSTFVRVLLGAIFLMIWARPGLEIVREHWRLIVITGVVMAALNLLMFAAIARIPVGIAVAIEFWGPMALALTGSRRRTDLIWIGLALTGILLFTPLADASFDTVGVLLAITAGAVFAAVLVYSSRLGLAVGGVRAAALAMAVATLVIAPISLGSGLENSLSSGLLVRLGLAAVAASCVGLPLEFAALIRIRPAVYAILICLEPAIGAILAFMILGERIGAIGIVGILVVSVAAVGATRTSNMSHT